MVKTRVAEGSDTPMTFTEAAAQVLRLVGKPLHYKDITDLAIEKNLLSHVGKSPEVTMGARLAALLKKNSKDVPLVRVKPGVFALREWDEATIKAGLSEKGGKPVLPQEGEPERATASARQLELPSAAADEPVVDVTESLEDEDLGESDAAAEPEAEVAAAPREVEPAVSAAAAAEAPRAPLERAARPAPVAPGEAPARAGSPRPGERQGEAWDDEELEPSRDEVLRAEMAAEGAELFDEEDDDDRPILGADPASVPPGPGPEGSGAQRRRRRRRRGRGRVAAEPGPFSAGGGGLPSYTVTPAFTETRSGGEAEPLPVRPAQAPIEPFVSSSEGQPYLDDLGGRELADAVAFLLNTLDRNGGQVGLRQLAENAQRRGRVAGDLQLAQAQIAAAIRADSARRLANGQRVRFRFSGGKVALTDWLLGGELARLEAEAQAAVERYREASRRALLRKLQDLPGHAIIELVLLVLERTGLSQLRALRRPGMPGGEAHFTAVQKAAFGEVKTAIVIRRDGREIGRERVADLRGSLHHYGPATAGWLITTGQVLSGAREECAALGAAPVALCDGVGLARLCEEQEVAVVRAQMPIALPDVDLLEALRAT